MSSSLCSSGGSIQAAGSNFEAAQSESKEVTTAPKSIPEAGR